MRASFANRLAIGAQAPDFSLRGVDSQTSTLETFQGASVLIIMFTCNHCPYVKAYEDRFIQVQTDYAGKGVRLVGINANEDKNYPEDSYEEMVNRSRVKGYNFPYLRDVNQSVARAYGATHTPELFVFDHDRRLRYTGLFDDNWRDPSSVKVQHLRLALEAMLAGRLPDPAETFAIGCTIKWLPS